VSSCTPSRRPEPLFTLHTDTPERFAQAEEALASAYDIGPESGRPDLPPLLIDRVAGE
jgi:thymidine phosphorylase